MSVGCKTSSNSHVNSRQVSFPEAQVWDPQNVLFSMRKGATIHGNIYLATGGGDYEHVCHIFAICAKEMSRIEKQKSIIYKQLPQAFNSGISGKQSFIFYSPPSALLKFIPLTILLLYEKVIINASSKIPSNI